ncbi:MAG: c-type cytochrome [Planctomycetes bacterium]|nr:c-type cytochrome [Planctomycetota bacterium]
MSVLPQRAVVWLAAWSLIVCVAPVSRIHAVEENGFRAGAAAIDITPTSFPVIVNGYFNERTADAAQDRIMARALVLDDGATRLAIVVVDNLMIPRDLLDQAKELAARASGIRADRMLISATHTHSAPSAMACLGSRADEAYRKFLPDQLAKAIVAAESNLAPARIGWTVVRDYEHNHCRRWIFRADRMPEDPFGVRNVRAHMHPGHLSPNHIGPSGPADPDLSMISVRSVDGRPIAVLGNYAMHYYGATPLSADFCGRFGDALAERIGATDVKPAFVGMMSQGTSGDSMWPDFSRPAGKNDLNAYTEEVVRVAKDAYDRISYRDSVSLAMAERTLRLRRRVPDAKRLEWARATVASFEGRAPNGLPEIYAREQVCLHEEPEVELKLQAVRIGELGITAIPDEVYGITGLKLKAASPLEPTFNIELANGAEGYIPPPEQHALGGYTTWAARTAALEVDGEPKIVETLLELLEEVAGKPRRKIDEPEGAYVKAVLDSKPDAYWRLDEMAGAMARDRAGTVSGSFEPGVALYLPGPTGQGFPDARRGNRTAHFAGGRMHAVVPDLGDTYSVEFWFWNGLPHDASAVTGYLFSRGRDEAADAAGDHLGIGGTYREDLAGKLFLFNGNQKNDVLVGKTALAIKQWYHVAFVRSGRQVRVHLDGNPEPEITGEIESGCGAEIHGCFLGGRNDRMFGLEGRIDEAAVYRRALSPEEIQAHVAAAGREGAKPHPEEAGGLAGPDPPPRSPTESMAMHHVRDGFVLELVAAEPLVVDPVAIAWGADGRLWVAEMADYPSGMDGNGKPGGRIRVVSDSDGDGTYDASTVFLEQVPFPNGVLPWRRGALVTAAPEIFYAEDTDGDGRADVREPILTGFFEGNQQLRVNGLQWGLDNWVHCALGSHHFGYAADSKIRSTKTGTDTRVGGRDFRFHPDSGAIDPLSGPSQFGRNTDNWGNWYGEQNSYPLWHYVLEDRYTRRNARVAPPDPRRQLLLPANPKVYPFTTEKRFHSFEQSGHFTSACSAMVYRDERLFGPGDAQHSFTCEPFHNLVHHAVMTDDGVSFRAERAAEEPTSEFFASADRWCRPVMTRTGPDGALWIVDMYRYMIEHPQWLPKEGQDELRPYFRSGDTMGRIYRIYPKGSPPRAVPRLDTLDAEGLASQLESPNGWCRDVAQQLLVERRDPSSLPAVTRVADSSRSAAGRMHALATLDGLRALDAARLERAMRDPHPAVRRLAVRLSEPLGSSSPSLVKGAVALADDDSAKVRLQVACSLGEWRDARIGATLVAIAARDPDDPHILGAVLSSIHDANLGDALAAALDATRAHSGANRLLGRLLGLAADSADGSTIRTALARVAAPRGGTYEPWQFAGAAEILDVLEKRQAADAPDWVVAARHTLAPVVAQARERATDAACPAEMLAPAVRLLARDADHRGEDLARLADLLSARTDAVVQDAIIDHLGKRRGREIAESMLANWDGHAPARRGRMLAVLLQRAEWIEAFLDAVESGRVAAADLDLATRQQLAAREDAELKPRIGKILARAVSDDRQEVVRRFSEALTVEGDFRRGAAAFEQKCAKCHRIGDRGHEVGPNLVSLTNKSPQTLLTAILDPSQAVEPKYANYVVVTSDGLTHTGILDSETGNSVTILGQEGRREVLLRSEIEAIRSTGKSMMPDGFEKELTVPECADIMAYLARVGREG